jgi:hypothetical protein
MPEVSGAFADAARAREAELSRRLATSVELDRSFEGMLHGAHQINLQARQRLDVLEVEIRQAAAGWPALETPAGARGFQAYLAGKTREIHKIVADAAADSQQRAAQVQALAGRYSAGSGQRSASETDSTGRGHEGERAEMVGFGSHMPRTPPLKPDSPDPAPPPQNPRAEHPLPGLPTDLGGRPVGEGVQVPPAKFGPFWVPPEVADAGNRWINTHAPNRSPAEWMQALSDTLGAGYARGQQEQMIRILQTAQAGKCTVDDAARSLFALGLDGLGVAGAVPLAEAPPIAIAAAAGALADGVLNIGDLLRCVGGAA